MTRYIKNLILYICVAFSILSCLENEETSAVSSCDNNYIRQTFLNYVDIIENAASQNDCTTITDENENILSFIDDNYNCIVIYLVLADNNIDHESQASTELQELKSLISSLSYQCETNNSINLNALRLLIK